ncbi:MAG: UTP--glucose-1-phosphate uridylyltransferase [Planctomycetaceae bacterium]
MTGPVPPELAELLKRFGQSHLLRWWDELDASQRKRLLQDVASVDFELVAGLTASGDEESQSADNAVSHAAMAERAEQPANLLQLSQRQADPAEETQAACVGEQLLAAGRVGAILVAGGQGTRLGFDDPKGTFPIGPVTGRSMFQIFAEQLLARSRKAGATIPYFVMTSRATHDQTLSFFESHEFFGLPRDSVFFFSQQSMPAVDAASGRILLSGKDRIALSPDGHGGMLAALQRADLFAEMRRRGIEHLFYHQVDNPATVVCDPAFLGHHVQRGSEMSTKVVAKTSPDEAMGVVVSVDGRTRIIEYSDLPKHLKVKTDDESRLWFRAGNTAIHAFDVRFLERMAADSAALPFHMARKRVPHIDDVGDPVKPATENAWKFERFIFDVLPRARNALVMEVDRCCEFLPVKRSEGSDSPAASRAGLIQLYERWLAEAGIDVCGGAPVEISPLFALDAQELLSRNLDGAAVHRATVFDADGPHA